MCQKNALTIVDAKAILNHHKLLEVKFTRARFGDVYFTLAYTDDQFAVAISNPKEVYSKLLGRAYALLRLVNTKGEALKANHKLQKTGTFAVAEAVKHLQDTGETWPKWFHKSYGWNNSYTRGMYVFEDVDYKLAPKYDHNHSGVDWVYGDEPESDYEPGREPQTVAYENVNIDNKPVLKPCGNSNCSNCECQPSDDVW